MTDIKFDDDGKVSATRFRFSHTPVRYQKNFIDDLILTRRATDQFSEQLVPLKAQKTTVKFEKPQTFKDRLVNLFGLQNILVTDTETEAPNAFTYSLFYVYYDQYTYIRGVLA